MSKAIYDAESTVLLRATGSAAVTATTTSAVDFAIDAGGAFAVAINVEAVDLEGDHAYSFSVVGQDAAGSNGVTIVTTGSITKTGEHLVYIDSDTAAKMAGASVKKLGLTATVVGTTSTGTTTAPSINYSAWLNPVRGAGRV